MLAAIVAVSFYSAAGFDASENTYVVIDAASGKPSHAARSGKTSFDAASGKHLHASRLATQDEHSGPAPAPASGNTISVPVPQTTATLDHDAGACAKLTGTGTYFTVKATVGTPKTKSDKPQVFDIVADTGSDNVIIPDCACRNMAALTGMDKCSKTCFTGQKKSSTFSLMSDQDKQMSIVQSFGSGDIESVIASDIVKVGSLSQKLDNSLLLMVKSQLQLDSDANFQGILGLGLPQKTAESAEIGNTGRRLSMKGFLHSANVSHFSICANDDQTAGEHPNIQGALRMYKQSGASMQQRHGNRVMLQSS